MARKAIQAKGAVSIGPYSQAVEAGNLVYLSGQTPLDPITGRLKEGGIEAQTLQCLSNLFEVLKVAGLNASDVVKVNVFLKSMSRFDEMNRVYSTQFVPPYPARTTIGVAALPLGADIEIEMIACRK